ncbi:MAG: VPLPA-CTERM sorting domain-containing protein [Gammaproteobacteria bacterium]|nr:VPLPA-CTERM sorting domain-containing protein [Gammaproteobacteria bacterium]
MLSLVAVLAVPAVRAATVPYYLNQSNENVVLPDGTSYATVVVSDVGADIQFTVSAFPGAFNAGSNFGFQSFGFNLGPDAVSLNAVSNFLLPTGWSAASGANQDGFGNFAWVVSGAGNSRQSPLTFTITGVAGDMLSSYFGLSSGTAGEGNVHFAGHIAGFDAVPGTNVTSAYFGGGTPHVVPLPAAAWLLLSGVAGLGVLARRRKVAAEA